MSRNLSLTRIFLLIEAKDSRTITRVLRITWDLRQVPLYPDLILLDLAMARMNGAEAASILSKTMPHVSIVLLKLYQNIPGPSLASAIGVKAVLDQTEGLDKLLACARSLLKIESAPESA
jgi:DNA-binding NarL/FixJ family response regulator